MPSKKDEKLKYVLTCWVLGDSPEALIDVEEVERLREARDGLLGVMAIEEKFDYLVSSFEDLERLLLEVSLRCLLHPGWETDYYREQSRRAVRYLVSFLSQARLYRDQTCFALKRLPIEDGAVLKNAFESSTHTQYDSHFSYRLLEALRNLMQHASTHVDGFWFNTSWDEQPDDDSGSMGKLSVGADLLLAISDIVNEGEIKASVRDELAAMINGPTAKRATVGLRGYTREYLTCWYKIHSELRDQLKEYTDNWERIWQSALDRQTSELDSGPGLYVAQKSGRQSRELLFYVSRNLPEQLKQLKKINSSLERLSARFVSGFAEPGKVYKS